MRPHLRSGTLRHERGRIILDLPIPEAEDIMMAFPSSDGFHRDMYHVIEEAQAYVEAIPEGPGVRIVVTEREP